LRTTTASRAALASLADDLLAALARQVAADAAVDVALAAGETADRLEDVTTIAIEDMHEAESELRGAMQASGVNAISRAGYILLNVGASIDGGLPESLEKFTCVKGPIVKL
jgi:hypothetical protein